jgi:hypothetical protein
VNGARLIPGANRSAKLAEVCMEMRDLDMDLPADEYDAHMLSFAPRVTDSRLCR